MRGVVTLSCNIMSQYFQLNMLSTGSLSGFFFFFFNLNHAADISFNPYVALFHT